MTCSRVVVRNTILIAIGTVLFIGGILVGCLWQDVFKALLGMEMVLTTTSKSYGLWEKTPIPMFIDFHMFNWTNPQETLNNGAKPHFTEIGPYVFREDHTKVNLKWNNNGTVTFQQVRKWNFVPERSNGSLDDEITNVNVIAMTVGGIIEKYIPERWKLPLVDKIINELITHEERIYVTKTVRELLFDGYYDNFLNITEILQPIIKLKIPFNKFGWFYSRNMSQDYDGVYNMYTGSHSLSELGNLYAWNYNPSTNFFNGSCGKVSGTTGELWPPDSSGQPTATVFASDVCSSVTIIKASKTSLFGLDGWQYVGDESAFDNGTKLPEMKCFCLRKHCQPSGTRDLSTCRYGAPAFVSYPHFYLADPYYMNLVLGMRPSKELHEFNMVLQEKTSIPLSVNARLQINIFTQPLKGLSFYSKLPEAYLPQLWFNQHTKLTKELASELYPLKILNQVAQPVVFTLAVIGLVMAVIVAVLWYLKRRKREPKLLVEEESED